MEIAIDSTFIGVVYIAFGLANIFMIGLFVYGNIRNAQKLEEMRGVKLKCLV